MNPIQKANMYKTLRSIQQGQINNHQLKVRQIITITDGELPPFAAITGEQISTNDLFNNRTLSKKVLRAHQSSSHYEKNYQYTYSTEKWSRTVNRYLQTYTQMKQGKNFHHTRLKTCNGVFNSKGKNEALINFHKNSPPPKLRSCESEGKCNFKITVDRFCRSTNRATEEEKLSIHPQSINLIERPQQIKAPLKSNSPKRLYFHYLKAARKEKNEAKQQTKTKMNEKIAFPTHSFLLSNKSKKQIKHLTFPRKKTSKMILSPEQTTSVLLKPKLQLRQSDEWEQKGKIQPWETQVPNSRLW